MWTDFGKPPRSDAAVPTPEGARSLCGSSPIDADARHAQRRRRRFPPLLLTCLCLLPAPVVAQGPTWASPSLTPSYRESQAMVYDLARGRMVLFGGTSGQGATPRNDTWTFDGTTWTDHGAASSVNPRSQPALCYAPGLGTVMFGGGVYPTAYFDDTWVFSGNTWQAHFSTNRSAPRMGHDMVWASGWRIIVMFGGYNGGTLGDTWSLGPSGSGAQWMPMLVVGGIPPRQGHAMAFDRRRNRVVVFGGADAIGQFLGDTWELSRATPGWQWNQRTPAQSPPRRWAHEMAHDPSRGVTVLTGGYGDPQCGNYCARHLDDVWEYDGVTWRQRLPNTTLPAAREGSSLVWDSLRRRLVLQSGADSAQYHNETWYYDAPLDSAGSGMPAGGSALRCLRFPVAGQPTGYEFDSADGFAWFTLGFGPAPVPTVALDPPIACGGRGPLYSWQPLVVAVPGSPRASLSFQLPASMAGLVMTMQGLSLDLGGSCLRVTDPLTVTVQAP